MATITIDISDPQAALLAAKAKAQGLTLEEWFRKMAEKEATPAQQPQANFKEWARKFDEWIDSHDDIHAPVLSSEAISRDSIYPDRS